MDATASKKEKPAVIAPPASGLVRLNAVLPWCGLTRPTAYKYMKQGRMPAGHKVSTTLRLIPAESLHAWKTLGPDAWAAAFPEESDAAKRSFE